MLGRLGSVASTRALEAILADPFVHLRDEDKIGTARSRFRATAGTDRKFMERLASDSGGVAVDGAGRSLRYTWIP